MITDVTVHGPRNIFRAVRGSAKRFRAVFDSVHHCSHGFSNTTGEDTGAEPRSFSAEIEESKIRFTWCEGISSSRDPDLASYLLR